MILSVTCRHGTDKFLNQQNVRNEISDLSKFAPDITRAKAIFSKQINQQSKSEQVLCHLSICLPHKQFLDIYEYQKSGANAFTRAKERLLNALGKRQVKKLEPIAHYTSGELK